MDNQKYINDEDFNVTKSKENNPNAKSTQNIGSPVEEGKEEIVNVQEKSASVKNTNYNGNDEQNKGGHDTKEIIANTNEFNSDDNKENIPPGDDEHSVQNSHDHEAREYTVKEEIPYIDNKGRVNVLMHCIVEDEVHKAKLIKDIMGDYVVKEGNAAKETSQNKSPVGEKRTHNCKKCGKSDTHHLLLRIFKDKYTEEGNAEEAEEESIEEEDNVEDDGGEESKLEIHLPRETRGYSPVQNLCEAPIESVEEQTETKNIKRDSTIQEESTPMRKKGRFEIAVEHKMKSAEVDEKVMQKLTGLQCKTRVVLASLEEDSDDDDLEIKKASCAFERKYRERNDVTYEDSHRPPKNTNYSPICVCEGQRMEAVWNKQVPYGFHSQEKQMEFEAEDRRACVPKVDSIVASSEFIIGKHMKIIVYLCGNGKNVCDSVLVHIVHYANSIRFRAFDFVKSCVRRIDTGLQLFSNHINRDYQMEVNKSDVFAEFFRDDTTSWFILRQYDKNYYLRSRLYISLESWLEIKSLLPNIDGVIEHYKTLYMLGRAKKCSTKVIVETEDEIDSEPSISEGADNSSDNADK